MAASARRDGRKQRRYRRRKSQRRGQRAKTGQTYTESQQSTAGQIGLAERFVGWISLLDSSQQEESSMSTSHGSSAACGIAASLIG
jgi:hypothetical protein